MIDDKKIEEAKDSIFNKHFLKNNEGMIYVDHISEPVYLDYQIKQAIELGAKWAVNEFLKNLWHPASKEPRKDVSIIVETHNDKNMFYYAWNRWQDNFYPSWTDAVLCSRVSRWLYIDDLFQKEGGEQ